MLLTIYPITGTPSIGVLDLASTKVTLLAAGSFGWYAPTGHLLVLQDDGTLQAARFDAAAGTMRGAFTTVADGIAVNTDEKPVLSETGTLLYLKAAAPGQVVRVSRSDGRDTPVDPEWRGDFGPPALSPDGTQLAISVNRSGRRELWLRSLTTGTFLRLSAGGSANYRPTWTADGRQIAFISDQRGLGTVYQVPADGSAAPRRLLGWPTTVDEAFYTHDGRWLVLRSGSGGGRDIFFVRAGTDSLPRALVASAAEEYSPSVSPDGRWLAYTSDETGRSEIYVRPFPDTQGARYAVSHAGGSEPVWSHSGKELFFRDSAKQLVAAEVATGLSPGGEFRVVTQRVLFSTAQYLTDNRNRMYAVGPDDRTFYFVKGSADAGAKGQLVVVLNWFDELIRKVGR
jgi:serine/threonine-protein kinase